MSSIFKQVFPGSPDEAAQQLLLRMAGLTVSASPSSAVVAAAPDQEDAREFVDSDLVDAARAGDVVRFIKYNYDENMNDLFSDRNCTICMGDLGVEIAAYKLKPLSSGQASAALRVAANDLEAPALALDIMRVMQHLGVAAKSIEKNENRIIIKNGYFSVFEFLSGADLSAITLKECIFDDVYIDARSGNVSGPRLESCLVERVFGVISRDDLPAGLIDGATEISSFKADIETASDIRQQPLPHSVRVLLIALRKLFVQPGRGRKENAFPRGLDDVERTYVPDVLSLIAHYGFAHPQRIGGPAVWISNRARMKEAMGILRAPQQSQHPIIVEARKL